MMALHSYRTPGPVDITTTRVSTSSHQNNDVLHPLHYRPTSGAGIQLQVGTEGKRSHLAAISHGKNVPDYDILVGHGNLVGDAASFGLPRCGHTSPCPPLADIGTLHFTSGDISLTSQLLGIHDQGGFDSMNDFLDLQGSLKGDFDVLVTDFTMHLNSKSLSDKVGTCSGCAREQALS